MTFQEFTASDGTDEVMFDVDVETGKIVSLYAYKDNKLEYYSEARDDFFSLSANWVPSQNPLFVKCPPTRIPFCAKAMLDGEFVFSGDEASDLLFKMAERYGLNTKTFNL